MKPWLYGVRNLDAPPWGRERVDRVRKLRSVGTITRKPYRMDGRRRSRKPGHVHGRTDDLGYGVDRFSVHVHDFNATLLHLLGLNHEKLTYRAFGLDQRLTGVHGGKMSSLKLFRL